MTNKDTEIRDDDVGGEDGDARRRKDEARSDDEAGPSKRRRVEEDQVSLALKKIGTHIGNEKKFKKASALLQQLLDQQEAVTSGT